MYGKTTTIPGLGGVWLVSSTPLSGLGFGASGLLGYELRAWKDYVSRRTVAFSGCCMLKRRGSTVEGMSRVYNQLNIPARVVF